MCMYVSRDNQFKIAKRPIRVWKGLQRRCSTVNRKGFDKYFAPYRRSRIPVNGIMTPRAKKSIKQLNRIVYERSVLNGGVIHAYTTKEAALAYFNKHNIFKATIPVGAKYIINGDTAATTKLKLIKDKRVKI